VQYSWSSRHASQPMGYDCVPPAFQPLQQTNPRQIASRFLRRGVGVVAVSKCRHVYLAIVAEDGTKTQTLATRFAQLNC
jgi:hypothetical protein